MSPGGWGCPKNVMSLHSKSKYRNFLSLFHESGLDQKRVHGYWGWFDKKW